MVATTEEILQKEHLLAQKAQGILEHQEKLKILKHQKKMLKQEKPTTEKKQLSYEESLKFGERLKQYEAKLQDLEIQLQKTKRELNALKLQAKKLLPISGVKVKVSTDKVPQQTFCIKHLKTDTTSQEQFEVEQLP